MKDAQVIYNRILELKKKKRELTAILKDQYAQSPEYLELNEKIQALREKRKQVTQAIDSHNSDTVNKLDDLKIDLASEKELFNDVMLNTLVKGETVELQNEYQQAMLPIFSVSLRADR